MNDIWQPVGAEGLALLERYGDAELDVLPRFFEDHCGLQAAHPRRVQRRR